MKSTLLPYYVTQRDKAAPVTAPVPADPDLPRTCVIGAGSAGLACAKNLYLAGVPFDCFEKGSRIGGNWLIDNPNGVSACYDHLEISTSVRRMAFSDFPMPADYPPYARHDQVAAYFDDYAEHFGLLPLITFDTEVTSVEPVDPGDQGGDAAGEMRGTGRWRVTTRGPGGEVTRDYDAVIVCNGHHWYPRLPDPAYPGQDEFAGEQIHAHSYRDASQLAGRDVVVVGAGNSALDISSAAAHREQRDDLAASRPVGDPEVHRRHRLRPHRRARLGALAAQPHPPARLLVDRARPGQVGPAAPGARALAVAPGAVRGDPRRPHGTGPTRGAGPARGHVLNVAPLAALAPVSGEGVYAASKHAVLGFSLSTAIDLRRAGHRKVRVSTVCPDGMWTPMLYEKLDDPEAAMSFSGVLLQPGEVADVVAEVARRPKLVRVEPRWRGLQCRLYAAAPSVAVRGAQLVEWVARAGQRRAAKRLRA